MYVKSVTSRCHSAQQHEQKLYDSLLEDTGVLSIIYYESEANGIKTH